MKNILMKNKARCQNIHARQRFRKRHGIEFTRKMSRDIIKQIQMGKATFVESQSNRISIFDVTHECIQYRVVYDKNRKTIVTVLPNRS